MLQNNLQAKPNPNPIVDWQMLKDNGYTVCPPLAEEEVQRRAAKLNQTKRNEIRRRLGQSLYYGAVGIFCVYLLVLYLIFVNGTSKEIEILTQTTGEVFRVHHALTFGKAVVAILIPWYVVWFLRSNDTKS